MNTQTVTIRRVLDASCEEVFDAWLDAEGMSEWMRPAPALSCRATLEPRVGGRFCIVMTAPGTEVVNSGRFLVLDRPTRLQFTWISSRWSNSETLVTVDLRSIGDRCELILTHERFPAHRSSSELVEGWSRILECLAIRTRALS